MSLVNVNAQDVSTPFKIDRVYWISGVPSGEVRGKHAYHELEELVIAVSGSCSMIIDDGLDRTEFQLDEPDKGLLVGKMIWREIHRYSPDCVLLVLASGPYDPADYIRDYDQFVAESARRRSNAQLAQA